MQAQAPGDPYVGLWSRIEGFDPHELSSKIAERRAVRSGLMRSTIHLVSDRDCLELSPLMQPVRNRMFKGSAFSKRLGGADVEELLAFSRRLLESDPQRRVDLEAPLAERWPGGDPASLTYAAVYLQPLVQVPPRGLWGESGQPRWTTVENWLGSDLNPDPSVARMVERYLAAFGPASVTDIQAWSGQTKLRAVVDELPHLRRFLDESGTELLDLPDAPLPDPATSAPVRFLPEYDNLLLGHKDRSRMRSPDCGDGPLFPGVKGFFGTALVDGYVSAAWKLIREGSRPDLEIYPAAFLDRNAREPLAQEGSGLLALLAAGSDPGEVRFASAF